ncbi:hypothetical protein ACHAPT_001348 [Fusarium lateritium]
MRVAFLGCGQMGSAIASALLQSRKTDTFRSLILSVNSQNSKSRLEKQFSEYRDRIQVLNLQNVQAAKDADTIILAHMPYMLKDILSETGMREAFKGKLVISILAGINARQIQDALGISKGPDGAPPQREYELVRAMPNLAAQIKESMTLVKDPGSDASPESLQKATGLLEQFGKVLKVPEETYHVAGMLTGAYYALTTVALDGLMDGSVSEGMAPSDVNTVAIQCLKGLTKLMEQGKKPEEIREFLSAPEGASYQGIATLERGNVRSAYAEAIVRATDRAKELEARGD